MLAAERERVAAAARDLAAAGLVRGTSGNVSLRAGDHVAVTPTGGQLALLRAEQIAVVDLAGRHVHGPLQATSELDLHLSAYRRHGCGAVVHSHATAATAVGTVLDLELPLIHYEMLLLGGPVRVAPFAPFGTPELAELVADALADGRQAALLANHGAVTVGHDLDAAVAHTHLLEWLCEVYLRAAPAGGAGGLRILDAAQQQAVIDAAVARRYGQTHAADDQAADPGAPQ